MQVEVDDRGDIEGQGLRKEEPSDNGNAERTTCFTPDAAAKRNRKRSQKRSHRRHHDGPEALKAALIDCVLRFQTLLVFGVECEIYNHDGVLFYYADQQDDAKE